MADAAARAGEEVRELVETFRTLVQRSTGGLLGAFAVLTVTRLVFQTPGWVVAYLSQDAFDAGAVGDLEAYATAGVCTGTLQLVGEVAVAALTIGLLRSVRVLSVAGRRAAGGAFTILWRASRGYLATLAVCVIVSVGTAVGALFCCVGAPVALFFLLLAPYFVTARDLDLRSAVERSVESARARPAAVAVSVGALLAVAAVTFGLSAAIQSLMGSALSAAGVLVAYPLVFLLSSAALFFSLAWIGALGVSTDRAAGRQ